MMKKIFFAVLVALMFGTSVFAQAPAQPAPKVLVLVNSPLVGMVVGNMNRIIKMKEAGIDVRVIFEGGAVLTFLIPSAATPAFRKKIDETAAKLPKNPTRSELMNPKLTLVNSTLNPNQAFKDIITRFKAANIPYSICGAAADILFEVYDEIKAAGEPISPKSRDPIDISPYIKQGYQVVIF